MNLTRLGRFHNAACYRQVLSSKGWLVWGFMPMKLFCILLDGHHNCPPKRRLCYLSHSACDWWLPEAISPTLFYILLTFTTVSGWAVLNFLQEDEQESQTSPL